MGESLVQRLEQFSYYERLSEHGGEAERTVFIFRNIDIRGKAYHVLSRIKDAPADYTGRTNFIAQHLVFTPNEVANMPTPAVLLNHWSGWKDNWEQEPRLFENESWAELDELTKRTYLPAKHWLSETADSGRAAGLLGLNAGVFTAHDFKPKLILELLSESLELLQLEGPNWRSFAWQRTFSVGCQPQDNPADFRWRFLTSGLPFESSVTQGRAPLELRKLRAPSNSQQVQFAQKGPSPPQFTRLPRVGEAIPLNEGETLILDGEAQSLPGPSIYRWYRVEKDNVTLQEIDGAHGAKLEIPNSQRGKHRYKVRAWDSITDQYAESPLIVVEVKEKVKIPSLSGRPVSTAGSVSPSSGASKPVRQLQLKKRSTYSSRTSESSLGDELVEEVSPRFYRAHANTILIASVLFSLAGLTAAFLQFMEFFEPRFKNNKNDWWALKVTKNPLAFENHPRITEVTRTSIANYKQTVGTKDNINNTVTRDHLLVKIAADLISTGADTPVRNDSAPKNEVRPLEPISDQQKNSDKPVPKEPKKKLSGPIHVILADREWSKLIKPLDKNLADLQQQQTKADATLANADATLAKADDRLAKAKVAAEAGKAKQNSKTSVNNVELAKANDERKQAADSLAAAQSVCKQKKAQIESLERTERTPLLDRKRQANQLQDNNSWPYFQTNITPTLRWSELGQKFPEGGNTVSGEWRANRWNFETENWSLQISQSGVVYQPTNQINALLVDIAKSENSSGTDPSLKLLLFSTGINNRFQATLYSDDLMPNVELQELLNSIAPANINFVRIIGSYPSAKNTRIYTLSEIHVMNAGNTSWKLGIKEQLTSDIKKSQTLKQITNAFAHVESFWLKVSRENKLALGGVDEFPKAVDPNSDLRDGHLKRAFWEKLNLLCLVAIYNKQEPDKPLKLEDRNAADARKILLAYIETPTEGSSLFRDELMQLVDHLGHLQDFWKMTFEEKVGKTTFAKKSYNEVKTTFAKIIEELEMHGGQINPTKLQVDLQFQAYKSNWFTITRLNCLY